MSNIDLSGKTSQDLLTLFNEKAALLGLPQVKRFSDRKAAERRVSEIIAKIGSVPQPQDETRDFPTQTISTETPTTTTADTAKESDDMATKNKGKTNSVKKGRGRSKRAEDALVGEGSYRDRLLKTFLNSRGEPSRKQIPMGDLVKAVYGNNYKEYRAPLMMVMKGLRQVLAANKTGREIRKTRENKENHFGLYNRTDPKSA